MKRMTAASIYGSPQKLRWGFSTRRTRFPWGETGVFGVEADVSNRREWRGMGPSAYARVAEIMSGRAISQQGLAATCKDPSFEGAPEGWGGVWSGGWARRSDEGGVMPSEATLEVVPTLGNAQRGRRSPGHSVAAARERERTWPMWPNLCWSRVALADSWVWWLGDWRTTGPRGVCGSALELPGWWVGQFSDKWCAEPRSEPDSGKPTVRDRRGALRNVAMGAGLRPGAKVTDQPPDPNVRALNFYPDIRTHGLKGVPIGTGDGIRRPRGR